MQTTQNTNGECRLGTQAELRLIPIRMAVILHSRLIMVHAKAASVRPHFHINKALAPMLETAKTTMAKLTRILAAPLNPVVEADDVVLGVL